MVTDVARAIFGRSISMLAQAVQWLSFEVFSLVKSFFREALSCMLAKVVFDAGKVYAQRVSFGMVKAVVLLQQMSSP